MSKLQKILPTPMVKLIKPFYSSLRCSFLKLLDIYDNILGKNKDLVPPRSLIFIGDGDFEKIGKEFLSYFINLGHLKPTEKVLDVGCGIGRMAVPLTKYLSGEGEYYGFDIVQKGIGWCSDNVSKLYPNFHFQVADIYNEMYNPKGKYKSSEYKFQYEKNYFDFVFLTSVFTHMFSDDVENYLSEISGVMKKGARCLITFFLINNESFQLINTGKSSQNFIFKVDENSFSTSKNIKESAIAYKESYIRNIYDKNGLSIIDSIYYGSWCSRNDYKSYQDIVIAMKL